jgi:hypothetical protein
MHRIMWTHGTRENLERFVLLEQGINSAKASVSHVYKFSTTIANYLQFWSGSLSKENGEESDEALMKIRHTINIFSYLSFQSYHQPNFADICNSIRTEFGRAEQAWVAKGNTASGIVNYWDAWIRNHQRNMGVKPLNFIDDQAGKIGTYWNDKLASGDECERKEADKVLGLLSTLQRHRSFVYVDLDKLH